MKFDDLYLQDIADALNKMSDINNGLNHQIQSLNNWITEYGYYSGSEFQVIVPLPNKEYVLLNFDYDHDAGRGNFYLWVKSLQDNRTDRTVGTIGDFSSWSDCFGIDSWQVMNVPEQCVTLHEYNRSLGYEW